MDVIGEDSNSKIGQPEVLHSFKLSTNRNGQVLCDPDGPTWTNSSEY